MLSSKKAFALSLTGLAALSVASLAQDPTASETWADRSRQIVVGGQIDWLERSDVSALKEGVIQNMEFNVGRVVEAGAEIGHLYDRMAELTEAKAKLAAQNIGDIEKAKRQKKLAMSERAKILRLERNAMKGIVSQSEIEKADADLAVAEALLLSATENQKLAKADYDLAVQAREEHKIKAPYRGVIIEQRKFRGDAVRANEGVVSLGRTDKLRFVGWMPLETAFRLRANEVVDLRPTIEGADLPIEQKKFRGKVTSVSREVNTVRANEAQVVAEIDNPDNPDHPELELRQGMKAEMTIHLDPSASKAARAKQ